MAMKLNKQDEKKRDELVSELNKLRTEIEEAIGKFNDGVATLKEPVTAAIEKYNAELENARAWTEDIANQAESEFDEKSDKWQEGERGEAARSWIDEWQSAELEEFQLEFPDELADDLPDHIETLENLPVEPE